MAFRRKLAVALAIACVLTSCKLTIETSGGGVGGEAAGNGQGGTGGAQGGAGDAGTAGGGAAGDDAALKATFDEADPVALARAQVRAETAAYLFHGLVEQKVDPAILDTGDAQAVQDTVQAIADMYGADLWAQAGAWADSLDPKALVPSFPVYKQSKCLNTHGCPTDMTCSFDFGAGPKGIDCVVTGCGDGKCTWCPDIFPDLSNLIVKSWCSYTCVKDYQNIVGIAVQLNLALSGTLKGCYKFDKPIPCAGGTECYPNAP